MQKYIDMLMSFLSKRSRAVERKIYSYYVEMLDYILAELGKLYRKSNDDGTLNKADIRRYKRLDKFKRLVVTSSKVLSKKKQEALQQHLEESYEYSYDWMCWGVQQEARASFDAPLHKDEIIEKAASNDIAKLTLSETLEKQRKKVVAQINEQIAIGLANNETYDQMAKRIEKIVDGDSEKAMRIVRTETKRVREQAQLDAAVTADEGGVIMHKRWVSVKDERVRDTAKANHKKLHGVTIPVDEAFDLGNGVTAMACGLSGTPYNDINCRCITTYKVKGIRPQTPKDVIKRTFEEYKRMKEEIR